jgi:arylsulfatase A-like enzyme
MVLNIDIAPTLLDYAGIEAPDAMQGASLRPMVEGRAASWRTEWLYELRYAHNGTIPPSEGIRTERWKYFRWTAQAPPAEELYDLAADPLEEHNLAADPDHQETLAALRARTDALVQQAE